MKTILSSLLILLVPAAITKAATLTVDNRPGSNAMYANFPEAYAAANDGDTILIAGSSSGYSGGSVYKRLTIIGSGFLHNENGIPGVNPQRVSLSLDLRNDALLGSASGTTLIGIDGLLTVHPNLTGITIDKCRSAQFDLRSPVSITRCYDASSITFGSGSSGSVIRNSIVRSLVFNTTGINADRLVITSGFSGDPSTSISNSIFVFTSAGNFTRDSTSVSNCMAVGFDTL